MLSVKISVAINILLGGRCLKDLFCETSFHPQYLWSTWVVALKSQPIASQGLAFCHFPTYMQLTLHYTSSRREMECATPTSPFQERMSQSYLPGFIELTKALYEGLPQVPTCVHGLTGCWCMWVRAIARRQFRLALTRTRVRSPIAFPN